MIRYCRVLNALCSYIREASLLHKQLALLILSNDVWNLLEAFHRGSSVDTRNQLSPCQSDKIINMFLLFAVALSSSVEVDERTNYQYKCSHVGQCCQNRNTHLFSQSSRQVYFVILSLNSYARQFISRQYCVFRNFICLNQFLKLTKMMTAQIKTVIGMAIYSSYTTIFQILPLNSYFSKRIDMSQVGWGKFSQFSDSRFHLDYINSLKFQV